MIEENNVIIADGRSLPTPSEFVTYPTLREQSTENALGDLVRKIISSRWKIEMKWDILTPEQMDLITELKFKQSFLCIFPATDGRQLTKTMYVGDIKPSARKIDPSTKLVTEWKDFSCNFIQVVADKYTGGAV